MKRVVLAAFLVLGLGVASAGADELQTVEAKPRMAPVRYEDLDLSQQQDAEALLNRLRFAAARVCAVDEIRRPGPALRRAIDSCRAEALAEAVAEFDRPELTRVYADAGR